MSYDDMLHLLNLPPLHARLRYLKLVTMFNIINGHLYFPQGIFVSQQPTYSSRRTSQFDFCRPRTQTDFLRSKCQNTPGSHTHNYAFKGLNWFIIFFR
jgi:hypothetical protein